MNLTIQTSVPSHEPFETYREKTMVVLGSLFGFRFRSNLTTVTDVIVRIKLNEQSADRRLAKTNLLLE
jgi:hypothetical protein